MGRPSEISTKSVSTRIPMTEYIELLKKANGRQMSVSEYICLKLYSEEGSNNEDYENKIDELQDQLNSANTNIKKFKDGGVIESQTNQKKLSEMEARNNYLMERLKKSDEHSRGISESNAILRLRIKEAEEVIIKVSKLFAKDIKPVVFSTFLGQVQKVQEQYTGKYIQPIV